jgi:hypothetical protein
MFHASTAVLSFLLQTSGTAAFLNRYGLGPAISTLPASVVAGGAASALTGGFGLVVTARAMEAVIRGSLFRAAYELFYAPMLPAEKRAVKSINDVTVDRLGDALGGGFAYAVVMLAPAPAAHKVLLGTAAAFSAVALYLASRLNRAYVRSLERSLEHHAAHLDVPDLEDLRPNLEYDSTTSGVFTAQATPRRAEPPPSLSRAAKEQLAEILSGDRERIRTALATGPQLERALLPHVVPLLARRSVSVLAERTLERVARRNVGMLSDYLLDRRSPPAVRAALPRVLATTGDARAADALLSGLADQRADVRIECGRALDFMRQELRLEPDADRVFDIVRRELGELRRSAATRQIVPGATGLDHVCTLLAVVLPRDPARAACEAIRTDDPQLRGLALEYLETTLPSDVADALLESVGEEPDTARSLPSVDAVREELQRVLQQVRSEILRVKD